MIINKSADSVQKLFVSDRQFRVKMAQVIDANSEGGFVLASLMEFMKAWESGANARLFLESTNGSAFMSFGCFLGQPTEMHVKPKRKEKSKKKQERDNLRAANFQAAMNQNGGESAKSCLLYTSPSPRD